MTIFTKSMKFLHGFDELNPIIHINHFFQHNKSRGVPTRSQMKSTNQDSSPESAPRTELKVILVDDDHSMLRLHQVMLGKFLTTSFVDCVDNALDAMLRLELVVPDLLIVDLNMPGIDGFNLLNLLDNDHRYGRVTKVVLSGLNAREVRHGGGLPQDVLVIQKPLDFRKMTQIQLHLVEQQQHRSGTQRLQSQLQDQGLGNSAVGQGCAPRKKVLVIDDNPDIRRMLVITLEAEFEVLEAADGEGGWSALLEHDPDLLLLDIMLPGELNGLQLLERVRADPAHSDTWVGLISARGQKTDFEAGQALGANAYFVKPLSPQKLLDWCRSKLIRS